MDNYVIERTQKICRELRCLLPKFADRDCGSKVLAISAHFLSPELEEIEKELKKLEQEATVRGSINMEKKKVALRFGFLLKG